MMMDTDKVAQFAVVANALSGTASTMGEEALHALINTAIGDNLHSCDIVLPEAVEAALERAFSSEADAVVVIGGDGTCRSAAKFAIKAKKAVAFLPGGTMNLLPNRHWGGLDIPATLKALGEGAYATSKMDVGHVNEEIFLIAAAFGVAPALARLREEHRASETFVKGLQTLIQVPKILPHLMRPSARLEAIGVKRRHLAALAIVIGNADLALGRLDAESDSQTFECVGAEVKSPLDFLVVMARAFFDPNWRDDDKVTTSYIKEGKVFSNSRRIAMTLDGEIYRLASPAHVRLMANQLKVLVHAPVIIEIAEETHELKLAEPQLSEAAETAI